MSRMPPPIEVDIEFQSIYRSEVAWAGITEAPAMDRAERHRHDFWEFLYIVSGTGRITVGQDQFSAEPRDLFVYPPGVEHVEVPTPGEHLVVKVLSIINTSDMEFMNFWPIGDLVYTRISGSWLNEAFERVINRILDEFKRMELAYTVRVKALSFEFQSYLVQYVDQNSEKGASNQQQQHVIRSRQYIQSHYQQNIKLTDIAADSYVSTYYLSHLFKEYTGFSPMNYLSALRIRKAQELLEDSHYSISEISQLVGYEDLQHFSNAFKKNTGYSPRAYRQIHQKQET